MEDGYINDVEYTGSFYSFLAPAWLGYIAAINGYQAPRLDRPFTWCDLGCGKGVTAALLAATHPGGEFHACDFNPAHIDYAEGLRRASNVENLKFYMRSFRDLLAESLPPFDFIVMHGVYSWVPDDVRAEIKDFLRLRLKPGGLVMVSYNVMPGWAHLQPVRHMMNAYAAALQGDSIAKARKAFEYVHELAAKGAMYFKTLPAAAEHLKNMARQDIRYIAHEYLTPHGDPFYFSEVEKDMQTAGLTFAGSMLPPDNYPELMVAEAFRPLLAEAPTRSMQEMHRDIIFNTTFRQDLYAAQPPAMQQQDIPLERFDGLSFCLTNLPERLPLQRAEGPLTFDLRVWGNAVRAVHDLLAARPASAAEIHRTAKLNDERETSLLIQQLVVAGHIAPAPGTRRSSSCAEVNSALVAAGLREQWQEVPLACSATATASYIEIIHASAVASVGRHHSMEDAAAAVLAQVRGHAHPVNLHTAQGEKRPATDAELLDYVRNVWRNLKDNANSEARLLRQFGILD